MKGFLALAMFCLSMGSFAQTTEYVGDQIISNVVSGNPPNYYYTKSVTIVPGPSGSVTISSTNGDFFIEPLATNPPPSPDQNYVRVEVPKIPVSDEVVLTNLDGNDKAVSYSYSDGLGRTTMSSAAEAGLLYEDVVQHFEYDPTTGRQLKSFLPYAKAYTEPGAFIANAATETQDFYNGTAHIPVDSKYFGESEYDDRRRMAASIGVGEEWNSNNDANDIKTTYAYKIHDPATDGRVLHWKIVNDAPQNDRDYASHELSVSIVTDVEGKESRSVSDMRGLSVTSQIKDNGNWYGSYNVYDDFGRVRFVIPPILATTMDATFPNNLTSTQIEELLFQYEYDERGRLKREKAPGAGWTEYVYDKWDRVVLSRHSEHTFDGTNTSWTFVKYDALNRPIMTGIKNSTQTRDQLQASYTSSIALRFENLDNSLPHGYTTGRTLPDMGYDEVLTINFYDNYNFISASWDAENHDFTFQLPSGFTGVKTNNVLDLSTGSKVRVLGTNTWLNTVIYYDDDLRPIQTIAENHLGGLDILTSELDWKGELSKMLVEHSDGNNDVEILTEYEYAHNGDLLRTWQTIDEAGIPAGDRVLVSELNYNVLGQLVEKNLHSTNGTTFLQSVDYDYTIRGWTSAINDADLGDGEGDLFGMQYNYTSAKTVNGSSIPGRHDGVVSSLEWNATNNVDNTFEKTISGFNYDGRNRLENTKYATANGANWTNEPNHYDMSAAYDDNGNIETLTRKSEGSTIDNLTYTYEANSNKLTAVADASNNEKGLDDYYSGTDYAYNSMGNMTSDLNKEIVVINYNHMQLVDKIEFGDGTEVRSTYDAAGNRLTKGVYDGDNNEIARIDYVGLVEYLNGEVNQVFTSEGRAYRQNNAYHYEYFLTDHQGNNRVAFGNLPERHIYTATMETESSAVQNKEESVFAFPANIRSTAQNHTPLGSESVALNGSISGKEVGPAKVLTIATDDEVEIDVWAKYTFGSWNNTPIANIASLVSSAFGGASTGTGAESASGSLSNALGNPGANGLFSNAQSQQPRAYLQYLFFDASYNYVSGKSGFVAVGADADGKFDKLSSGKIIFDEPGYLFVYVVNESSQNADVFFDDFAITHASGTESFKVSQVNEYYPFGLRTDKSWRSEGYVDPGLLYQASFAQYDSLTGYYDFLSRNYDPALGRFFAVDPQGQFSSPYVGMGNNPVMMVDPDGELAWFVPIIIGAALGGTAGGIAASQNDNMSIFGGIWRGALIGGAAGAAAVGTGAAIAGVGFTSGTSVGVGASIAAGAVGGGLNGGLSAAVFGGDVGRGIWTGALTGAVGAGVGGTISNTGHTGLGAFAGGASAGAVGAGLNGGDVLQGALLGGAISYGTYLASTPKDFRQLSAADKRGIMQTHRARQDDVEIRNLYDSKGKRLNAVANYPGSSKSVPSDQWVFENGMWTYKSDAYGFDMVNGIYDDGNVALDVHTHLGKADMNSIRGDIKMSSYVNKVYNVSPRIVAIGSHQTAMIYNGNFSFWSNSAYSYTQGFYFPFLFR